MNILIVDDEKMSRMTMESIFSGYGTCKSFASGKMAVKSFVSCLETKERFDFVILDIFLENENGVEILKLIRLYEKVMGITATHLRRDTFLEFAIFFYKGYSLII